MKNCPKCGISKDPSDYGRDKARPDGTARVCKSCNVDGNRKWRASPEGREKTKIWRQSPNGRANNLRSSQSDARKISRLQWSRQRSLKDWQGCLVRSARSASRDRGHSSPTITPQWIVERFALQGGLCHWTGVPMVPSTIPLDLFQPSLDRLDNTRGYDPDNVVLVCWAANMARGSHSTQAFATWVAAVKSA